MNRTIGSWMASALLAAGTAVVAQEARDSKPGDGEKAPGQRLRVQFLETRQLDGKTTLKRSSMMVLHADDKPARAFVGVQVPLATTEKAVMYMYKEVGVDAQAGVQALADGRYRLDATFEVGSALGPRGAPLTGDRTATSDRQNPILNVAKTSTKLTLREGETVPFASLVDPVTGELVRLDATVTAAPDTAAAHGPGRKDARLRAQFVLSRRQGDKKTASRPYSVVLLAGEQTSASLFSGSQLPMDVTNDGQRTVMLKDVGARARVSAELAADGRYRLDVKFDDGSLLDRGPGPSLLTFRSEARLFMHPGEAVVFTSAVDPQSGDTVDVEVTLEALK
jgi:hypothetical protein